MKRTERFKNMDEVLVEKQVLRAACTVNNERMQAHLETIRDPELRKKLIRNSIQDAIQSIAPLKALRSAFGNDNGIAGNLLGIVLGSTGKTTKGKTLGWIAGLVLPAIANAFMQSKRGEKIIRELRRSWARISERLTADHEEV
ncbi:MAG: hypothetical protein WAR83_11855 [Flavobacteriales bacterium]|nr:hypothetical protein [Flavobacteriales bacterium]